MSAKPAASGKTAKHAGTAKHAPQTAHQKHLAQLHAAHLAHLAHLKHHPNAKPPTTPQVAVTVTKAVKPLSTKKKPPKPTGKPKKKAGTATKRGLALMPGGLPLCAAEGLAASLLLAGKTATLDDILALHWLTPGADEDGATILASLATAQRYGLAGAYPLFREVVMPYGPADRLSRWSCCAADLLRVTRAGGLILGLHVAAGPHTVVADPSGAVWSWGELYDPAALGAGPVEEAWEVQWQ